MTTDVVPYLGSVGWYRALWQGKRQAPAAPNRTLIRGAWGRQALSVPIRGGRRSLGRVPWHELRLSEHDDWRHKHWQALQSAYGALPYFQYVRDNFEPVYLSGPIEHLCELNHALDTALRRSAHLDEAARWLRLNPLYTPPARTAPCPVPDDVCAFELLCAKGPAMVFELMRGGEA